MGALISTQISKKGEAKKLIKEYICARSDEPAKQAEQQIKAYVTKNPSLIQGHTYDYRELDDILSLSLQEKKYKTQTIQGEITSCTSTKIVKQSVFYKEYDNKNTIILPCTSSAGLKGRHVIERMKMSGELLKSLLPHGKGQELLGAGKNTQILIPYNINGFHWYALEIIVDKKNKKITAYAHDNLGRGQCNSQIQGACKIFFNSSFKGAKYSYEFPISPYTNTRSDQNYCGPATVSDILALADGEKELPTTFANQNTAFNKQIDFLEKVCTKHLHAIKQERNVYYQLALKLVKQKTSPLAIEPVKQDQGGQQVNLETQIANYKQEIDENNNAIAGPDELKKYIEANIAQLNQFPFDAIEIDNLFSEIIPSTDNTKDIIFELEKNNHFFNLSNIRRAYVKTNDSKNIILLPCMGSETLKCENAKRDNTQLTKKLLNKWLCKEELNIKNYTKKGQEVEILFPYFHNEQWSAMQISIKPTERAVVVCLHGNAADEENSVHQNIIRNFVSQHFKGFNITFNTKEREVEFGTFDVNVIGAIENLWEGNGLGQPLSLEAAPQKRLDHYELLEQNKITKQTRESNPFFQALNRQNHVALPDSPSSPDPKQASVTRTGKHTNTSNGIGNVTIYHQPSQAAAAKTTHPCMLAL